MSIEQVGGAAPAVIPQQDFIQQGKAAAAVELKRSESQQDAAKQAKPVSEEEVVTAADKINETIKSFSTDLKFSVDKDTHRIIVTVMDSKTGEVIRQIPPDEVVSIAKALDTIQGLIIRKKA